MLLSEAVHTITRKQHEQAAKRQKEIYSRHVERPELAKLIKGRKWKSKGVRELIVSPLRDHSRKPDEAYDRIEQLFDGPYCELFSRTNRLGWSAWGKERGKYGIQNKA